MSIRDHAAQYLLRRWQIVPLEPQGKKCVHTDWLTRTYTADDIGPTQNLGIKSAGGLVDVDCDCPEATRFAEIFLPQTPAVYGRVSRPRSHWLYRCPEIDTPLAYQDLVEKEARKKSKGEEVRGSVTLLEIRVKHQSMAPPSIHPSGESVEWDEATFLMSSRTEVTVARGVLLRGVQLCATGVLLTRYYNPPGARHDWGVAMAGFFRRLKLTQAEAERLFQVAGVLVNDPHVKDRLDAVRTTYSMSEETPSTGGTRLEALMGDGGKLVVASLYKIWGADAGVSQTRLAEMNTKHAVVQMNGGRVVIMTEAEEDGERQLRFTNAHEFHLLYSHQKVQIGVTDKGTPTFVPLSKAWLEHPKRRSYNGIELAPNGHANAGYYNLWQGFRVAPQPGDWSLFQQHIRLLVNEDAHCFKYVIAWMSETVKHPERPIGIALTFKGGQGVGKSTFARWFGAVFGVHFLHLDSEHRLLGQFNNHLMNAIVVLADEAVWAGGKAGLGALKRMITEPTLDIERKGLDVIHVKNMLHMIVASNEDWVVPVGFDNRRFAVFKVSDQHQQDRAFFGAVHKQLFEDGGLAAMLYDLLHFDTSSIDIHQIPRTQELEEQTKWSMNARQAWWYEQLIEGTIWGAAAPFKHHDGKTYYEIDPMPLYESYVVSLKLADHRVNPGFQSAVGRFLRTMLPEGMLNIVQHEGRRYWIIPTLEVCRQSFCKITRMKVDWPEEEAQFSGDIPF